MRLFPLAVAPLVLCVALGVAQAQSPDSSEWTRPRTVSSPSPQAEKLQQPTGQTLPQNPIPEPSPSPSPSPQPASSPLVVPAQSAGTKPEAVESEKTLRLLSPQAIRARITEAERLFRSRPMATSITPSIQYVTLAALDQSTGRIHHVTLLKETFLTKGAEFQTTSSLGVPFSVRVLRANGVNTAVTIFDHQGRSLIPLLVEFPIEKRGVFKELAYYTSAHPALLSPQLSGSGQLYVRSMLDLAAKRLHDRGIFISPQIMDVAERLCLVEHVDHARFRQEDRGALYQEIYALFALNELNTYRYSVSSAGAGGMVQMIPWTYNLMKQRHAGVGLTPDFVAGMRNHGNALQAMLLYMQDTWNDLAANTEVQYALSAKLATQTELLAAGYNSNAARLPGYLKRGGSSWRTLIPRETQMYLQIYKSFESLVPMKPRPTTQVSTGTSSGASIVN